MDKINFVNNSTPALSAENLNQLQDSVEDELNNVENQLNNKLPKSGGTMTGTINSQNVVPKANNTYDLGDASNLWRNLYIKGTLIAPLWNQYTSGNVLVIGVTDELVIRARTDLGTSKPIQASAFNVWSSRRYKKNIKEITEERANLLDNIEVVTYDYKNEKNGTDLTGVIAEDVYQQIPEVVTMAQIDGEIVPDTVSYSGFVPYLIKKVQMHEKTINELLERVQILEGGK